jgi:hypothetical protein
MRDRIVFGLIALVWIIHQHHPIPHHTTETNLPILENAPAVSAQATGQIGPDDFPFGVNPLTGQNVADPTVLLRRPIVAKISNAPPLVRPQAGLGAADLVYEHYAEGGLTRLSAIYYSQAPERVGSIRSARLIDYELMPMYHGLLAFSGASIGVEDRLNTSEFADRLFKGVLYGLPYYWRDESIPVPHNMFTNTAALWQLADETGINAAPDLHGMAFHPDPGANAIQSSPASAIDIRYRATRVGWAYDPAMGLYARTTDGLGHFDGATLEQITAANVVVIYAEHTFTDIIESQWQGSISYSIEIKLWFEGDAVLFRDGQRYDGRWIRPTREDMLALRTADGDLLYLKPGNTWFQVMPLPQQWIPEEEWMRAE